MKFSREIKAGLLAIFTIVAFILLLNFLKGRDLFNTGTTVNVLFDNIVGLEKSRTVSINGIKVGVVESIDFYEKDLNKNIVQLKIDTNYPLTNKSIAEIVPGGIMGVTTVKLIPTKDGKNIKDGDFIEGKVHLGLLDKLGGQVDPLQQKISKLTENLNKTLEGFQKILSKQNTTHIASLLQNLNQTVEAFKASSIHVNTLSKTANQTILNAGNLLKNNKNSIQNSLNNLEQTSSNLSETTGKLKQVDIAKTVSKLDNSLASLDQMLVNASSGKGSLGKLIKDDKLYNNLESASFELSKLMKDFKENPKRYVHFSVFGKKNKKYKDSKK